MKADALKRLRQVYEAAITGRDPSIAWLFAGRDETYTRYRAMFTTDRERMTAEDFRGFLLIKNNRHWDGIHRQGGSITRDMDLLRKALAVLLDESQPIRERLRKVYPGTGRGMVPGLGRAVITPILHICYPDKYGVLNSVAESALKKLGIWPDMASGAAFPDKYLAVNQSLLELRSELGIDLWSLDALWWRVAGHSKGPRQTAGIGPQPDVAGGALPVEVLETGEAAFGLEKHLLGFLCDNWEYTDLGRDWNLYEEDGELIGCEFDTGEVGRIDILARGKDGSSWLVIELKRGQSDDQTVGQLLRYLGWVRKNLAQPGERVDGLIVCREVTPALRYAIAESPSVAVKTYRVSFSLVDTE